MCFKGKNKKGKGAIAAIVLAAFIIFGAAPAATADCVFDYLADIPLDTQEQAGPGIIMFLLDDSGSMDWSIMMDDTYGDSSGLYHGYGYVFDDPGDIYSYSWPPLCDYAYYGDGVDRRMQWVTQWYETNKMYYNPGTEYTPWPRWDQLAVTDPPSWSDPLPSTPAFDMDPDNPRSLPTSSSYTLNMNAVYYDFGETISTQQILDAGGVIVDNSDVGDPSGSIIVDNLDAEYQESEWWGESSAGDEYNGSSKYSSVDGAHATWTPNLPDEGNYKVYVWYTNNDGSYTRDDNAKYTIHSSGEDTVSRIDQNNNGGQWVELGEFNFQAGTSGYVRVTHDDESDGNTSADAVKFEPQFDVPGPDVVFESTGPWDNDNSPQDYGEDYLWTPHSYTNYTATWTANNLDDSEEYNVYARWVATDSRSQSVEYQVNHSGGTETVSVNQEENGGQWVKLAEGLSFASESGSVVLDHYVNNSSYHRACADAVAFMPTSGPSPINLVRAHYYVKSESEDKMYLVNLDGEIEYWRINDDNGNMEVDSVDELEEVEDPPADIVTGRTYDEERVNFANWYSFYRKRELTSKSAVANVINDIQGVYIGILTIHDRLEQHALPVMVNLDDTIYDERDTLLGGLYTLTSSGGTPLRLGLERIGEYFSGYGGDLRPDSISSEPAYISSYMSEDSYPFFKADKGGECEQAFCIAMTDGYWNGGSPYVGNEDGNGDTDFDGDPFADTYSNTLADVAMYYYEHDLNANLADLVPFNNKYNDYANHQHLVTYSVSFGVNGEIDRENWTECPVGDCPDWPSPWDKEQNKIDDLYHAAVNGRGQYINAGDPEELVKAMEDLKSDIESRLGAAAAVATNSIQRQVGSKLYQGTYHSDNWYGDVTELEIEVDTGHIVSEGWSAKDKLDEVDYDEREILTYDGTSASAFASANSTDNDGTIPLSGDLIDYLRGDDSKNQANGGPYRVRSGKLGDIVHSAPYYHKGVIYIGANDGMLHAFDANTGEELFAYVPKIMVDAGNLPDLSEPGYSHKFYVDNTVYVKETGSETLLVGGLRKGGKGYFCLDVSNPQSITEDNADALVKWEYTADGDDDLGYSYSRAYIVNSGTSDDWVVIFGNGYGSVNEGAFLYVLDAETGILLNRIPTGASGCNGLSSPALIDVTLDGTVDYAYAGDLQGNMWKFDLTADDVDDWTCAYNDGSTDQPLIQVKNESGGQPITVEPDVMRMDCAPGMDGHLVFFGTGQYIGTTDFANTDTQTFFGVWDWQENWPEGEQADKYLGEFNVTDSSPQLSNAPSQADNLTLLEQTAQDVKKVEDDQGKIDEWWRISSDNPINYFEAPEGDTDMETDHAGWFFNVTGLEGGDRARVIRDPSVRAGTGDNIGVVTFIISAPSESPCAAGGDSWLYQLDACGGGRLDAPVFDVNEDEILDEQDFANPTDYNDDGVIDENDIFDPDKDYDGDGDTGDSGDMEAFGVEDSNGDGTIDENDLVNNKSMSGQYFGGQMLYTPIQMGDHLYINSSTGNINAIQTEIEKQGMSYWRVIQ